MSKCLSGLPLKATSDLRVNEYTRQGTPEDIVNSPATGQYAPGQWKWATNSQGPTAGDLNPFATG
jgi:hypothetical protein